jgi:hypothetical protein
LVGKLIRREQVQVNPVVTDDSSREPLEVPRTAGSERRPPAENGCIRGDRVGNPSAASCSS